MWSVPPCGGGVEYLHRDPASRRRRRKGKSQIWDSKIWSRVPRDSGPRKTALTRVSIIYKRQTRPLVREGASQKQDRNCQTVINIGSWVSDGARHQDMLADWLTVSRNATLTLIFEQFQFSTFLSECQTLRREEYKRSACEDVLCELKTLCVWRYSDTGSETGRS
jgi:hypothetical protein